jgi:hypothetical protein
LYVSNPSRQHVMFYYRTTQHKRSPDVLQIASGGQIEVGQKWSDGDRVTFIEQIRRHGGRSAGEVHGSLARFNGLVYRENVPVGVDEIEIAAEAMIATKNTLTAEAITNTAAGFDRSANGGGRGKRKAVVTETMITQVVPPGERPKGNELDFKLTIDPTVNSAVPVRA